MDSINFLSPGDDIILFIKGAAAEISGKVVECSGNQLVFDQDNYRCYVNAVDIVLTVVKKN